MKTYIDKNFNAVTEQLFSSSYANFSFKVFFESDSGQVTRIRGCTLYNQDFFVKAWDTSDKILVTDSDRIYTDR